MVKLKSKIPAYTLIESIIGMVIILLVFSIGMMIYINVVRTDRIILKTQVFFKMNEILFESKLNQFYTDEEFEFDNFKIKKEITAYKGSQVIKLVTVLAFDFEDRLIAEKHELVQDENYKD